MFEKTISTPSLLNTGVATEYKGFMTKLEQQKRSFASDEEIAMGTQLYDSFKTRFAPPEVPVDRSDARELTNLFAYSQDDDDDIIVIE